MRIALALKGVSLPCRDAMALPPEAWRALNPQGLMPALAVEGRVIPQAGAILAWLEDTWPDPALLPTDPLDRAEARAFGLIVSGEIHAVSVLRMRRRLASHHGADDAAQADWTHHWTAAGFAALEAMIARRPPSRFCFGDAPGWADLHLVPQWRASLRLDCDLTPYRRLADVVDACEALPAFALRTPIWTE